MVQISVVKLIRPSTGCECAFSQNQILSVTQCQECHTRLQNTEEVVNPVFLTTDNIIWSSRPIYWVSTSVICPACGLSLDIFSHFPLQSSLLLSSLFMLKYLHTLALFQPSLTCSTNMRLRFCNKVVSGVVSEKFYK